MTPRQTLQDLINKHVNAQIALSWADNQGTSQLPEVRKTAQDAERALNHFITNHEIG